MTAAGPPRGWHRIPLGTVVEAKSGNSKLIKGKLPSQPSPDRWPAFSASGQDVWRDDWEHERNAVIISAVGARCGKCFLAGGRWSAIANTHIVFPNESAIDCRFLWYLINDEHYWVKSGTAQPFVKVGKSFERDVALPPLPEQKRIVDSIESYLTRVDDAVASFKRTQTKLKAYRASVLKAAVEGRLVSTEDSLARAEKREYETAEVLLARVLKERRRRWEVLELHKLKAGRKAPRDDKWKAKYQEPVAPDISKLPVIPKGWSWASIDQLSECLDHLRVPVSKRERQDRIGTVPYYGANGQAGWIDRPLFDEALVLVVEDETFTGRTKPFSYLIKGPSWVNNHAHVLRALGAVSPRFLNAALAHYPFIPLTTGTTGRRKLTKKALMAAAVPVPPLKEQERIMEVVDELLSLSDSCRVTVEHQQLRSQRLRQAVLKWAFEGKLVDQEPTDEPAEMLLARIRAERIDEGIPRGAG